MGFKINKEINKIKESFPEMARVLEDNKETIHKSVELIGEKYKNFPMAFPLPLFKDKKVLKRLIEKSGDVK